MNHPKIDDRVSTQSGQLGTIIGISASGYVYVEFDNSTGNWYRADELNYDIIGGNIECQEKIY